MMEGEVRMERLEVRKDIYLHPLISSLFNLTSNI